MRSSEVRPPLIAPVLLVFALLLAGCMAERHPPCSISGRGDVAPSAGCLVIEREKLLLVETAGSEFGPPAGSVEAGEIAQCGAERETWEETGVVVQAVKLYHRFDNGFTLYTCEAAAGQPVSVERPLEIRSAGYYALDELDQLKWRFPKQLPMMKAALREVIASKSTKEIP